MIKNYFKIAWRSLRKHATYTTINIIGLTIGLGCCLMIALYVQDELSYDKYLAILIACLGLLGLATYTAQQRTKEIGVRKVLGASVGSIVQLLSKDFVKLVCLAIIIATPLAWWAMNKWLQDFAFRIEIKWWMFILAGVVAIIIALLTISFQAIKAAIANPVKSLRTE